MSDLGLLLGELAAATDARAQRTGAVPTLRPATVTSGDGVTVTVTFDGDGDLTGPTPLAAQVQVSSLVGPVVAGERVMVLMLAPHGAWIIGYADWPFRSRPISKYRAAATATLVLTGAAQAVVGAAIAVTTVRVDAAFEATAVFDFDQTAVGAGVNIGELWVDGAVVPSVATFQVAAWPGRGTVVQQWTGLFPAAGAHTLALKAYTTLGGVGVANAYLTHTTLRADVHD